MNRGSEWRRWEPHIHAPGTVLNDQFGGADFDAYIAALETSTPPIEALAITDYYVTETFEEVFRRKQQGRLPCAKLLFPNIELRLDAAAKAGFVNIHLLVSPEDPGFIDETKRILSRLQFHAHDDRFDCTRAELIRLGKKADTSIVDDGAALKHGATQFKVNFDQLRKVIGESDWAKKNILIAVAGAAGDGTSGLRQASDATLRQEIEKFAHIIFSSSPAQRDFWLGYKAVSKADLRSRYGGCKPCLHGSDAHEHQAIGRPTDNRFSWIKGALTFDALRQACIDPEGRAYVGEEPPQSAMASQVIGETSLANASWAATPTIPLNPGLVAIIGARGSGKTALADMIAAGCDAIPEEAWRNGGVISPSFLSRARKLVGDATVTLAWGGGDKVTRFVDGREAGGPFAFKRARYLSQQFVEELCSTAGVSDGLVSEIERVIFNSHSQDERENALDFAELRQQRTARYAQARAREAAAIASLSDAIAQEWEKEALVSSYELQVSQKGQQLQSYTADLGRLVLKGTPAQTQRHTQLSAAALALRTRIQSLANQKRTFLLMQDEVASTRVSKAPEMLREARGRHADSGLDDKQWAEFLLIHQGPVDKSLAGYIAWADNEIATLNGVPPPPATPGMPLIADAVDLATLPLAPITAEMARLEALFSADRLVREQYAALNTRIAQENAALQGLQTRLADAKGAQDRRRQLQVERDAAYGRVFEAILQEQAALASLYAPLMGRLAASAGTLKRLGFSVRRIVDLEAWAVRAEEGLLDRRKAGPFYGRGALTEVARDALQSPWETGTAAEIQAAMTGFIARFTADLMTHAPYAPAQQTEFRSWSKELAHWLFSTDHISVRYEVAYDGVDIAKLSPGTRGIVLLLLYLALDDADDRPLIIDQPEENLDPKSVYDELVPLFIAAKAKRQVIMVTHNANLVINTDADQIIIAEAGPHAAGGLPPITYVAGGLEDADIRRSVCEILEGGEVAFRERARRLRVRLER